MPGFLNRARRLVARAAPIAGARSGNVTILFALSLLPMVGLIGYGVDYGVAITDKAKLDAAADAAAVAAVATAKAYIAANPGQANVTANAIAAGIAQASKAFTVNAAPCRSPRCSFRRRNWSAPARPSGRRSSTAPR